MVAGREKAGTKDRSDFIRERSQGRNQGQAKAVKSRLKTLSDMRMLAGILFDKAESKSLWINWHWEESQ